MKSLQFLGLFTLVFCLNSLNADSGASYYWAEEKPHNEYLLKNIDLSKINVFESYEEKNLVPTALEIEATKKKGLLKENQDYNFTAIVPVTKLDIRKLLPSPLSELLFRFSNPEWNCGQTCWVPHFRSWEKRSPQEINELLLFKGKFEDTLLGKLFEKNQPGSAKKIEAMVENVRKQQNITEKDRVFVPDTKIQSGTIIDNVNYSKSYPAPQISHAVTVLGALVKKDETGMDIPIDLFVVEKQNPGLYPITINLLSIVRKRSMTANFDLVYTPLK